MKQLSKISYIGIPAILGFGFAWLGVKIIKSENNLMKRKLELGIQIKSKPLQKTKILKKDSKMERELCKKMRLQRGGKNVRSLNRGMVVHHVVNTYRLNSPARRNARSD